MRSISMIINASYQQLYKKITNQMPDEFDQIQIF